MKANALLDILSIWRLVDGDPSTKHLYLTGPRLTASVQGLHCGIIRQASKKDDDIDVPTVGLDGSSIIGVLNLFDAEDDVTLRKSKSSLILEGGSRRAVLRTLADASAFEIDEHKGVMAPDALRTSVAFLQACAAGGITRPVLTGIQFKAKAGQLTLAATDGERRYGTATIALELPDGEWVVPAVDLAKALQILGDMFYLEFVGGHLFLRDKRTRIKMSLLNGEFPSFSTLPKLKSYKKKVKIAPALLATAIKASAILDNDRLVTLAVQDGRARLVVQGQETGGFALSVGKRDVADINIAFDADWLGAVAGLGTRVTMHYKDGHSPVLFIGDDSTHRLWMSPVVRN